MRCLYTLFNCGSPYSFYNLSQMKIRWKQNTEGEFGYTTILDDGTHLTLQVDDIFDDDNTHIFTLFVNGKKQHEFDEPPTSWKLPTAATSETQKEYK